MRSLVRALAGCAALAFVSTIFGQGASLAFSNASGVQGGSTTSNLVLTSGGGPASIQWTLTYDAGSIVALNAVAGPSATAAAKMVQCANSPGSFVCLISGVNANPISDGVVAVINVTLSASAANLVPVGVTSTAGASPAASLVSLGGTAGAISVSPLVGPPVSSPPSGNPPTTGSTGPAPPPGSPGPAPGGPPVSSGALGLGSLSCTPAVIPSGSSAACSVSLNQAAPSGGAGITLLTSNAGLTLPAVVTVPAGSSQATFSVAAGTVPSNTSVMLTAWLNGTSQRFVFTLTAPVVTPPASSLPTISGTPAGVLDAAGYTPNVSPGSVFVVKGSKLCPDGVVQSNGYPLTPNLNGVSITFSSFSAGVSVASYMISTFGSGGSSQLAALLPSTVAPGNYQVIVTNNGVSSAPVPVTVVPRKFRLFTADSSGSGAAALQNVDSTGAYHYNRFTTQSLAGNAIAPAHPGDFLVAYGTGLGAVPVPDQSPPGVLDLRDQAQIQVLIGGKPVAPLYAGRSPNYPGLDQLNLQLPADVATGCTVPLQVSVDSQLSNSATIAIAPAGGDICSPTPVGNDVLTRLDQGGSLTLGSFSVAQLAGSGAQPPALGLANVNESVFGSFVKYSGFQLGSAAAFLNPAGSCQAARIVGNAAQLTFGAVGTRLDAGALKLTGPGNLNQTIVLDNSSGAYFLPLGAAAQNVNLHLPLGFPSFNLTPILTAGPYQLTGSGGADVGKFTANLTAGRPVTIPGGLPMSVDRTKDLTLTWSGGNPGDMVSVTAISGTTIGGTSSVPVYDAGRLLCSATADTGSITIPSSLLAQLPVTPADQSGIGYLSVSVGPQPALGNGLFSAPLTAGGNIDGGFFVGALGVFSTTGFQ